MGRPNTILTTTDRAKITLDAVSSVHENNCYALTRTARKESEKKYQQRSALAHLGVSPLTSESAVNIPYSTRTGHNLALTALSVQKPSCKNVCKQPTIPVVSGGSDVIFKLYVSPSLLKRGFLSTNFLW
ncbi:hypothetical protein J6590_029513 [Homalodisca vitripennis]|nr:hypothetical protein J6590_029513 [Homalodisca vitripennis]